jgi:biotin transporter BioY
MKEATTVQPEATTVDSRQEANAQLAEYVEQQPKSVQTAHTVLSVLLAVGVVLVIGLFIVALYVSFTWKAYGELAVPRWWMAWGVSVGLWLVVFGLDILILKADPPYIMPGTGPSRDKASGERRWYVTGQQAARQGRIYLGLGVLYGALWAGMYLVIALWSEDPLSSFITFVLGLTFLTVVVAIASSVIQRLSKSD